MDSSRRELSHRVSNQAPSPFRSGLDPCLWIPSRPHPQPPPGFLSCSAGLFLASPGSLGGDMGHSNNGSGCLPSVFPPLKERLHWRVPWGGGQTHVYMYILSASVQLLPSASPHKSGEEKGHAKACLTPPIVLHPSLPRPPGLCVIPFPQTQGTRGQKAGVGFALFCSLDSTSLLHHFLPVPVGGQGLRERTDLCSYFHTSHVQSG